MTKRLVEDDEDCSGRGGPAIKGVVIAAADSGRLEDDETLWRDDPTATNGVVIAAADIGSVDDGGVSLTPSECSEDM